jgi:hypothetical protein
VAVAPQPGTATLTADHRVLRRNARTNHSRQEENDVGYDNTNTGALFRNNDKTEEHETWPDYRGNINVDGTEYWLSAWLKTSKNGVRYMSLSIKPKNADTAKPKNGTARSAGGGSDPFDDTIPFGPEFR